MDSHLSEAVEALVDAELKHAPVQGYVGHIGIAHDHFYFCAVDRVLEVILQPVGEHLLTSASLRPLKSE